MDEIIRVDTIDQYNKLYGLETMYPLVGDMDLTKATTFPNHVHMNMAIDSVYQLRICRQGEDNYS